jgi:hypothetical protein
MENATPWTESGQKGNDAYLKAKLTSMLPPFAAELGCSLAEQAMLFHIAGGSYRHEQGWWYKASLHQLAKQAGCGISHCRICVARLMARGIIEALQIGTGPSSGSAWLIRNDVRTRARALERTVARAGARATVRQGAQKRPRGRTEARAPARADTAPSLVVFQEYKNTGIQQQQQGSKAVVVGVDSSFDLRDAKAAMPTYIAKTYHTRLAKLAVSFATQSNQLTGYAIVKYVASVVESVPEKQRVGRFVNVMSALDEEVDIDEVKAWLAKKSAAAAVVVKPVAKTELEPEMTSEQLIAHAMTFPEGSMGRRVFMRRAEQQAMREANA